MFYGVDGCRGGWCLAELDADGVRGLRIVPTFAQVVRRVAPPATVLVDIPIGLPDGKSTLHRTCDSMARRALGLRGSSIFPVPIRPALEAPGYEEANRLQRQAAGRGLSRQSWALASKILEVDAVLRLGSPLRPAPTCLFRESHPELCFAVLNGGEPPAGSKRSAAGAAERARLLRPFLGDVRPLLDRFSPALPAGSSAVDDILDALVLAVHARLSAEHGFRVLPHEPQIDGVSGLPMQISTAAYGRSASM